MYPRHRRRPVSLLGLRRSARGGSACVRAAAPGARSPFATGTRPAPKSTATCARPASSRHLLSAVKVERYDESTGQSQEVGPEPLRQHGIRWCGPSPSRSTHSTSRAVLRRQPRLRDSRRRQCLADDQPRPDAASARAARDRRAVRAGRPRSTANIAASSTRSRRRAARRHDVGGHRRRPRVAHARRRRALDETSRPRRSTPWSKVAQIDVVTVSTTDGLRRRRPLPPRRHETVRLCYARLRRALEAHGRRPAAGAAGQRRTADPPARIALCGDGRQRRRSRSTTALHWQPLQRDLPHTSVRDLIVHGNDLVVATHGRGFWILDDVQPLRELAVTAVGAPRPFRAGARVRVRRSTNSDTPLPPEEPTGHNPPDGAILDYALVTAGAAASRDRDPRRARQPGPPLQQRRPRAGAKGRLDKPSYWLRRSHGRRRRPGMHRFVWDLHEPSPDATQLDLPISAVDARHAARAAGALVLPGRYSVSLETDGAVTSAQIRSR